MNYAYVCDDYIDQGVESLETALTKLNKANQAMIRLIRERKANGDLQILRLCKEEHETLKQSINVISKQIDQLNNTVINLYSYGKHIDLQNTAK